MMVTRATLLLVPVLTLSAVFSFPYAQQTSFISVTDAVLQDPDNSSALALRAVKSIGQVKDKSSVPILEQVAATHGDAAVRSQALRAISHVLARQYE